MGQEPDLTSDKAHNAAGIKFIFGQEDADYSRDICEKYKDLVVESDIEEITDRRVVDSSSRFGYIIVAGEDEKQIHKIIEG